MASTISKNANISASTVLEEPVHIGPGCSILASSIGRYAYINVNTCIFSHVKVGRFSTFARNCQIGGTEHPIHHLSTSFFRISPDAFPHDPLAQSAEKVKIAPSPRFSERKTRGITTVIGNDVWIGASALVLKGVNVGDGVVIGAGSVVTKDVPPYAIVAGNPARVIRYRFDPVTIERLMACAWWNREPEFVATLPLNDIQACLEMLEDCQPYMKAASLKAALLTV